MNIKSSKITVKDNILMARIGADVNNDIFNELKNVNMSSIYLSIISIDNSFENTIDYANNFIELLNNHDICNIGICKDWTEEDENGYKTEPPIEIQLKLLKDKVDMLVIGRDKHTYQEIEDMVLSLFCDVCDDELGLLIHKLKKVGFAYYNSNYEEAWDSHAFIDFILFDSMFCCPIYVAKDVFCNIVGGML